MGMEPTRSSARLMPSVRPPKAQDNMVERNEVNPNKVVSDRFLMMFAPEAWSPASRFLRFVGPPFPTTAAFTKAIRAAESHRQKLQVLARVANRLRPGLLEDRQELDRDGYTPSDRSKEYAAVTETLFLELYSSLDGVRRTLVQAYAGVRGLREKSTNSLFARAAARNYGPDFPEDIREVLAAAFATWFPELRRIRTELSHGDIGSCHFDRATGLVRYMHGGLGTHQRALIIDDLEGKLNELYGQVTGLVDVVFSWLCSRLEPIERRVPCGLFKGRLYERTMRYAADLDFNVGACFSRNWFETDPEHMCPMRSSCGAYPRDDTA